MAGDAEGPCVDARFEEGAVVLVFQRNHSLIAVILTRMETIKAIRVVLVSPDDVAEEQTAVERAIQWARNLASGRGVTFDYRHWKNLAPGYHPEGAQALIEEGLAIDKCDLLIGVFWKRFGAIDKPPYSRTASEILRALEARKANSVGPDIKVYFCKRPYFPSSTEELDQQALVLRFKEKLEKPIVYRDYDDLVDFGFDVLRDLTDCMLKAIGVPAVSDFQPSVQLNCTPRLLRHESANESIPDLNLGISGIVPRSWDGETLSLEVKLLLMGMCTNPSDVVLSSGSADGTTLANGKSLDDGPGISFTGVSLTIKESKLQEDLWIRGIRINHYAQAPGSSILAFGVVTLEKGDERISISTSPVTLGILVRACQFFVTKACNDLARIDWPADGLDSPRTIRFFTVHFREAFPGAFKTREEESGWPGTATSGDVLMIDSMIPPHFDIFVTVRELPGPGPSPPVRALSVKIEGRGNPLSINSEPSTAVWYRRELLPTDEDLIHKYIDTQTPMVRIVRESHSFRTGWEIVRSAENRYQGTELVFGIMLAGRGDICPPKAIWINGNLAPITISTSRGPWLLPSFDYSHQHFDVLLETGDELSDPWPSVG